MGRSKTVSICWCHGLDIENPMNTKKSIRTSKILLKLIGVWQNSRIQGQHKKSIVFLYSSNELSKLRKQVNLH